MWLFYSIVKIKDNALSSATEMKRPTALHALGTLKYIYNYNLFSRLGKWIQFHRSSTAFCTDGWFRSRKKSTTNLDLSFPPAMNQRRQVATMFKNKTWERFSVILFSSALFFLSKPTVHHANCFPQIYSQDARTSIHSIWWNHRAHLFQETLKQFVFGQMFLSSSQIPTRHWTT